LEVRNGYNGILISQVLFLAHTTSEWLETIQISSLVQETGVTHISIAAESSYSRHIEDTNGKVKFHFLLELNKNIKPNNF